ncbi:SDR family oxidoreductase [Aldersonia sp. NBC_00410]|uniref:SDR family NAD(P)-dependent oxidoreductase n=1 Tax=Aldersonia sp. NBC_00410 TaxID=2975954 RepID=UPI0022585CF2|nr:SDR family oxidoreductase [Aldersonia sp. NBC_00410]MCX5041883.1 SDR family oxidoreductase [Aldersonia sp. NBC_00410]
MSHASPVAVVSGAGRGIGRGIALRLAADGYEIVGTFNRDEASAEQAAKAVADLGRECRMVRSDAADPDAAAALAQAVLDEFGRVDALVLNAGIASRGRTVADTDPAEIQKVLSVHALGAFYLCSNFAPAIRNSERGAIVLISSTTAARPSPGGAPYMMGKVALEALGRTLALEEQPHGTRVNIVAPGLVATDMGDRLARAITGAADAATLDAEMPFGRVTRPEDVAELVAFLISDRAALITGQRIEVHAGRPSITH